MHQMIQIPKCKILKINILNVLHLWKGFTAFDHVQLMTHFVMLGHIYKRDYMYMHNVFHTIFVGSKGHRSLPHILGERTVSPWTLSPSDISPPDTSPLDNFYILTPHNTLLQSCFYMYASHKVCSYQKHFIALLSATRSCQFNFNRYFRS